MKRTINILNQRTRFNVLPLLGSYAVSPLFFNFFGFSHFSTNSGGEGGGSGGNNSKPWLNSSNKEFTRILNQEIKDKYDTRISGGF